MCLRTFFFSLSRIVGLVLIVILIPLTLLEVNGQQNFKGNAACSTALTRLATGGTDSTSASISTSTSRSNAIQHYEYVFPDGTMYVYDMDNCHSLVKRINLPTSAGVRGVVVGLATHMLYVRSEEHTSELQSHFNLVCRLLLEK